jgi:hypothetical protein
VTVSDRARELAVAAAEAASDKLADDILAFDVGDMLVITDVFVLCSAPNDRQVKAIVDAVEERLRGLGAKPVGRYSSARSSRPRDSRIRIKRACSPMRSLVCDAIIDSAWVWA